ncbi:STAS domain-containing protein [Streptomyces microflavus]|uniref:STAS domain-containing protein n=1 Tax=Streptomyces microflavus TaxID=1919 RepID=UPI003406071A
MYVTTEQHGRSATLTPRGDIDFAGLEQLRACLAGLPDTVGEVIWDLRDVTFMDVAGLHLISTPIAAARVSLTNMTPQAVRLLEAATAVFPRQEWDRHLPSPADPGLVRATA